MREQLSLSGIAFAKNQTDAVTAVACAALETVDKRYSNGYPHYNAGERGGLAYHNGHHARSVGRGGIRMAMAVDCSPAEVAVSEMAGKAHDIVQLKGRGVDEAESAAWLQEEMRRQGVFPAAAIEIGSLAIIGTEPIFEDGMLVRQRAADLAYPSISAERVAKSVACADLGELYTPLGPFVGHELYREIQDANANDEAPLAGLAGFQRFQLGLLESYQYPLKEADHVLATHRPEVIDYSKQVLGQLERGDITTWRQLLEQDLQFMRDHS